MLGMTIFLDNLAGELRSVRQRFGRSLPKHWQTLTKQPISYAILGT